MSDNDKTVMIEDAQLIFLNFEGKEGQYNRAGDRNFAVVLPPDVAESMLADNWNVKFLKQREEDEVATAYLSVSVNYKNRPPKIVLITSRTRTHLDESSVSVLDYADIAKADLIINPYDWVANGKSGVKAYLKTLFVTIDEDDLERKYAMSEEN